MMIEFVVGLVFGAVSAVYYIATKKINASSEKNYDAKGEILFLNILILDKSKAVEKGVTEKISSKLGNGFFANKLASRVSAVANYKITDAKMAETMSVKLTEVLPEKLESVGLYSKATKVYQQGAFFVIRLNLESVDLNRLITVKAGEKKASTFNEITKLLGGKWVQDTLSSNILCMIASKIQDILPDKFSEKLNEKGIKADITVTTSESQCEFFYDAIAALKD